MNFNIIFDAVLRRHMHFVVTWRAYPNIANHLIDLETSIIIIDFETISNLIQPIRGQAVRVMNLFTVLKLNDFGHSNINVLIFFITLNAVLMYHSNLISLLVMR